MKRFFLIVAGLWSASCAPSLSKEENSHTQFEHEKIPVQTKRPMLEGKMLSAHKSSESESSKNAIPYERRLVRLASSARLYQIILEKIKNPDFLEKTKLHELLGGQRFSERNLKKCLDFWINAYSEMLPKNGKESKKVPRFLDQCV